jgi:carboxypeptidase C (cathepsin A)
MRYISTALIATALAVTSLQPSRAAEATAVEHASPQRLPPAVSVRRSMQLNGATLRYVVKAGALPVRDATGNITGEVAYTAYLLDGGDDRARPVTFAFNGGPGGASAILNFGALGPKRLAFGAPGDVAASGVGLQDNPGTWLDFTDLVFVDPIGTGYSRSYLDEEQANKAFFNTDADISYLSAFVQNWLASNGRTASPKYLVGESYGGFRVPRLIRNLAVFQGVGVRGGILISPFLDSGAEFAPAMSPIPWAITLPGMAAAHQEREGTLDAQHMAPVIAYARDAYLRDMLNRRSDPGAIDRMTDQVAGFTGLPKDFVRRSGARIEVAAFLREAQREQGKIGSSADPNFVSFDPVSTEARASDVDPLIEGILAPVTSRMVDFLTNDIGWKVDGDYRTVNFDIYDKFSWEGPQGTQVDSNDIRRVLAADPKLRLLVAHGWSDLSTPFMGSLLLLDQLPSSIAGRQVRLTTYTGGHMFFTRQASLMALHRDVAELYRPN